MESFELKEILKALELHSGNINNKINEVKNELETKINDVKIGFESRINELEYRMDAGFARVEERLDRHKRKDDGMRVELTETQETVDYLSSKTAQHEKKLRALIKEKYEED